MRVLVFALLVLVSSAMISLGAPCKSPNLRQGMAYKVARKVVLRAGFQTPTSPAYGYSEKDQKVISECNGDVALCNRYPEIDSCSGRGQCAMKFTDAYGNVLSVYTYGEITDGSAGVTGFEIKCAR